MEKTQVSVRTEISLHQVINALEDLAGNYPVDRLAPPQIDRIVAAARVLRARWDEAHPKERRRITLGDRRKVNEGSTKLRRGASAGRRKTDTTPYWKLPLATERRTGLSDRRIGFYPIDGLTYKRVGPRERRKVCQTSK